MDESQSEMIKSAGSSLALAAKHLPDTPVAPAHGIAAIALDMAMKYHDISTIKDGALYQQYKLEGRNLRELHLDMVFETAIKIEMFLLGASDRIAKILVDALSVAVEEDEHNAALRSVRLAERERQWQPIETAPQDGTCFLGGWHFQGRWVWRLGKWNDYHQSFNQFPSHHGGPFTHWMALPPPPAIRETDSDA